MTATQQSAPTACPDCGGALENVNAPALAPRLVCHACVAKAKAAEKAARVGTPTCPSCEAQGRAVQGPSDLDGRAYMAHCDACGYEWPQKITWE